MAIRTTYAREVRPQPRGLGVLLRGPRSFSSLAARADQRLSFDRLRRLGLRTQALKSALAAALAWVIGSHVPGGPALPHLAPLSAVLTIQGTVAESMQGAFQRVLGVVAGVAVAMLASHAVGITPLTIALLVVVAQALGALLRLSTVGTSQIVVSALLVLTIGTTAESGWLYGWGRIAETMVGALIGIAVNGLLIPPSYLPDARRAWQSLSADLRDQLDSLSLDLRAGLMPDEARAALERARTAADQLDAARTALQSAGASLRFNHFGRRQRRQLARLRRAVDLLEHAAIQLRGIARVLADLANPPDGSGTCPRWLAPDALGRHLGRLLASAEEILAAFGDLVEDERAGARLADTRAVAVAQRRAVLDVARENARLLSTDGWVALGAILADLDRMIDDLSGSATDLTADEAAA